MYQSHGRENWRAAPRQNIILICHIMLSRVVSMPSWELFNQQSDEYKESVLPKACTKRVSVEAGMTIGWERFVGEKGLALGIDHFGASAPCDELAKLYGFTAESVAEHTLKYLGK